MKVNIFMSKLRESIELDKDNVKNNFPAFNKIKLLNIIEKFLINHRQQKIFLDMDGCKLLEEWCKKDSEGSYPCINHLSKILGILSNLRVELDHLKECSLGKYVFEISKNYKISKAVNKQAQELIQKWSRIIFEISSDYSEMIEKHQEVSCILKHKRVGDQNINNIFNEKESEDGTINAYKQSCIPKKGLFDFKVLPVNKPIYMKKTPKEEIKFLSKKKK